MDRIVFLNSPYLDFFNVLSYLDFTYMNGKPIIHEMRFSTKISVSQGFHIRDEKLFNAVLKAIRKDCNVCDICYADEETYELKVGVGCNKGCYSYPY